MLWPANWIVAPHDESLGAQRLNQRPQQRWIEGDRVQPDLLQVGGWWAGDARFHVLRARESVVQASKHGCEGSTRVGQKQLQARMALQNTAADDRGRGQAGIHQISGEVPQVVASQDA